MKPSFHLLLGGARSGKSRRAEVLATASGLSVVYLATYATAPAETDPEMAERIAPHRRSRPASWTTIENRFDLKAVIETETHPGTLLLIDCLTLWLSKRMGDQPDEALLLAELGEALRFALARGLSLIVVSNELGMGLVPLASEARAFRDLCGRANQLAASIATEVDLVVAGLPLRLKGGE